MSPAASSPENATARRGERGIAIVLVLIAMVIVAGLASAALLMGVLEERTGRNHIRHEHAFAAAEAGIYHPVVHWDQDTYSALPVGDSVKFSGRLPEGAGSFRGALWRVNRALYVATAEGSEAGSEARHRLGLVIRLEPLILAPKAALVSRGPLSIAPSSVVNGNDRPPLNWACPATAPRGPALLIPPSDTLDHAPTCAGHQCLRGSPPILIDSSMTLPDLAMFGGLDFSDLRDRAAIEIASGVIRPSPRTEGETCVTAATDNWGDPYDTEGTCGDYMPLIYAVGDLDVVGGRGQGTLVVDGDLSIMGGLHFIGVIVVRGAFVSRGTGNRVDGAVVIANTGLEQSSIEGATTMSYSSCAVRKAQIGAGAPQTLRQHGWFQAY